MEGTYTYFGSQVVDPSALAALRSATATDSLAALDSLASSVGVDLPAMSEEGT